MTRWAIMRPLVRFLVEALAQALMRLADQGHVMVAPATRRTGKDGATLGSDPEAAGRDKASGGGQPPPPLSRVTPPPPDMDGS